MRQMDLAVVAVLEVLLCVVLVLAKPPQNPVQCSNPTHNCTIKNTYGTWADRDECVASSAVFPTTEVGLVAAVARAVRLGKKVKVISPWAHSIPKLACPDGRDGLIISTSRYNRRIVVDKSRKTVEVDAGVTLEQLVDAVAEHGLALPYMPYWGGVSIAGLISTGAHGSSLFQKGGATHEYVIGLRLVIPATKAHGYARIVVLDASKPDELNAAKVSLGVLGAISTVTLQLEPTFKHSITNDEESDDDIEKRVIDFGLTYEFGDVTWHPSQETVVYKKDFRVLITTEGDGVNDNPFFTPTDPAVAETNYALETSLETMGSDETICNASKQQVALTLATGGGLKNNDDSFTGYPVVGFHNRLITSSECLQTPEDDVRVCAWDSRIRGLFFHYTALAIDIHKLPDFIRDVKSLRDLHPSFFCNADIYTGILMRFLKNSTAFLGVPHDAVRVDIIYYRSRDPLRPRVHEDIWEEIEQMAIFKYGGRPHWGKNRPVAFIDVASKYPNIGRFIAIKKRFDPHGLFSSAWSDAMLGLTPLPLPQSDGCALDGLCICSKDAHCAPQHGYYCRPGRIYREARVCRKSQ